jgi:hypothetical protein
MTRKFDILVFKKNTLLENLNVSFGFSQGIKLLDDKLKNLQENYEYINNIITL